MTTDLLAAEAAANALHQHGPTRTDADAGRHGQTPRWQDCPRAETHRGAGGVVARAVLDAVGYDALRDKLASLNTTAADAIREGDALRAERDRYHLALSAIADQDWQILARFADVWDTRAYVYGHGDAFAAVARAALEAKEASEG